MKCRIFIVFICLSTFLTYSQEKSAKDILDKSLAAFTNAGGIKVSFSFTLKDTKNKVNETFNGNISLKNDKFFLETPELLAWYNGVNQWMYMKDGDEVNLLKPDENDDSQLLNPVAILSLYKKGFNYKYTGEKTIDKKKIQEVELIPQKKNDWEKVTVQIDSSTNLPSDILVKYKNGTSNSIKIVKYQTKLSFSDDFFSFDKSKYPHVEVIDLR